MNKREWFIGRRLLTVFGGLVGLPLGLSVLSIIFVTSLPQPIVEIIQPVYMMVVYIPIVIIGAIIYEPLNFLGEVMANPFFSILSQIIALLIFYYIFTFILVNGIRAINSIYSDIE